MSFQRQSWRPKSSAAYWRPTYCPGNDGRTDVQIMRDYFASGFRAINYYSAGDAVDGPCVPTRRASRLNIIHIKHCDGDDCTGTGGVDARLTAGLCIFNYLTAGNVAPARKRRKPGTPDPLRHCEWPRRSSRGVFLDSTRKNVPL